LLVRSCHQRLALHGPAKGLGHQGIEVGDEVFDPLLKMLLGREIAAAEQLADQDRKQISIWLIQEACLGVKWKVIR
jgi:hypothetical protein